MLPSYIFHNSFARESFVSSVWYLPHAARHVKNLMLLRLSAALGSAHEERRREYAC